jgi:hypothetical protein
LTQVGDGELAGKLANTRLKQLAQGNLTFSVPSQLGMSKSPKYSTTMNLHRLGDRMVMNNDMQESESHVETPIRDDFNRYCA